MRANRRTFIAAAAGSTLSCGGRKSPWRFFTIDEARIAAAVCDQVIPADGDPGAVQAGVVNFLDRQLAGFYKAHQQTYREGLARLGTGFIALSPERQAAALGEMEKKGDPFFTLIVSHTMQGFYGSPRHGGNREAASWKMLGIPFPPVRGQV